MTATRAAPPPPSWSPRLVLWHWIAARCCLLLACVLLCWDPQGPASSPFHPTTLAATHLVALGFLATSILGAFHAVAPLALRVGITADWRDWLMLAAVFTTATGVAAHLWLVSYSGIPWSGAVLVLALLLRLPSLLRALWNSSAPRVIRTGVTLSWLALVLAAGLGGALAIDVTTPFLPAGHQVALVAHAHLAIAGFGCLMAFSLGLRLLPMFLPARPPRAWKSWSAVSLLAAGALLMGGVMPFASSVQLPAALLLLGGVMAFLLAVLGMIRQPLPAPKDRLRPDALRSLMLAAVVFLLLGAALGFAMLFGIVADPGAMVAYGALMLFGFLGSLTLGVGGSVLPIVGWHAAWHDGSSADRVPRPPRTARSRVLGVCTASAWLVGVLLLVGGALAHNATSIRIAAIALAVATSSDACDLWLGWRRRGGPTGG